MAKKIRKSSAGGGKEPQTVQEALERHFEGVLGRGRKFRAKAPELKGLGHLLWRNGILGVGYGVKETAGALTPVFGARVYVARKRSRRSLDAKGRVPEQLFSDSQPVETDVVAVDRFSPLAKKEPPAKKRKAGSERRSRGGFGSLGPLGFGSLGPLGFGSLPPLSVSSWLAKDLALLRSPQRPMSGGCSVGPELEPGDVAGTLGCFVRKGAGGKTYILSNNHVLADSRLTGFDIPIQDGDPIFQPGDLDRSDRYVLDLLRDGAHEQTQVAKLNDVIDIEPSDPRSEAQPAPNVVDAALAEITDSNAEPAGSPLFTLPRVTLKDPPNPYDPKDLLLKVVGKVGRTTGATLGVVVEIDARFWIPYGDPEDFSRYAWFTNQIGVVPIGSNPDFSAPGDSGAAVFDPLDDYRLVGLLFAGGEGLTLVNPIDEVFSRLGISGVA